MNPLVSVVIPNHNYAKYLRGSIDSVLQQTYSNIEVIVVDDGSTDDSRKIVESYGDAIVGIFQENQGVSVSRNNGVAASNGDYIAFLDADDAWLPAKIEKQVELLLADPSVGMAHAGLLEIDEHGAQFGVRTDGMEGWVYAEMLRFGRPVILGGGSSILVRRSAFDAVAGFDTRLSTSADWDFGYSIAARFKVGFVAEPLVLYRQHNANMHCNIRLMEHDSLIMLAKAFDTDDKDVLAIRRACYGQRHKVLAGSYLYYGQYSGFVRNLVKSLWFKPQLVGKYLRRLTTRRQKLRPIAE